MNEEALRAVRPDLVQSWSVEFSCQDDVYWEDWAREQGMLPDLDFVADAAIRLAGQSIEMRIQDILMRGE
ncbi:hypothetical protein CCP3SC1AL1_900006 [Gammaproteobacteria bacterium]